jgi:hypothetical protein
VFAEGAGGADLVEAHEPRVPGHVGRDYGRQPASDPSWLPSASWPSCPSGTINAQMLPDHAPFYRRELAARRHSDTVLRRITTLKKQSRRANISPKASSDRFSFSRGRSEL